MLYYAIKVIVSALLIVAISEISKRQSGVAALLAALPITSLLAFIWLYVETGKTDPIVELSGQIFWLVIPSLILFLALPALLRWGWGFWPSLATACGLTSAAYLLLIPLLRRLGVAL
jgi:predicted neutral ceramidase superfamily lipid hydrolase